MARLPNVDGPSLTGTLRQQRELLRKQGTASPFALTGQTATDYVASGNASTLASANAYTDAATATSGLDVPYASTSIPALAATTVQWGTPTENVGGFVVSGGVITIPAGLGGVYTVTSTVQVNVTQATRGFMNLVAAGRYVRDVFTGDQVASGSLTMRLHDLDTVRADVYVASAATVISGWLTLYRLHA